MGKVAMEFITSEKTRMLAFKNRKKSLFKKAHDLSVLCDVDVCVIINGFLTGGQRNNQSEIWPEDSEKVRRIITKFKATNPNARRKKTSSPSSFFQEPQENSNKKMPFPVLDCLSAEQSFKLLEDLDQKLKMVDKRIDELQTHVDDQLPIIDSSGGEKQTINFENELAVEFFDDDPMNWVNQNFENDFPLNNEKLLDLPIEVMPENYIILPEPDPYIGMPPLNDYSATATVPLESRGLPPLPPSWTPSMPFLGETGMTFDYQMNDKEEDRFCTFDDISNFLFS